MTIKPQITKQFLLWRLKKIAYNLIPFKKLKKELANALPKKWDVISFSEKDLQKYQEMLKNYPDIMPASDTLDLAFKTGSFSRIGDGEFNNIIGVRNSFNDPNTKLAQRLIEICETGSTPNCLVCLNNYKYEKSDSGYNWFLHHGTRTMEKILEKIKFAKTNFGNAYFLIILTRYGHSFKQDGLEKIKNLWNNQKVLFVCNRKSPLNQDELKFFDGVAQKEFLHIPDKNAFDHYEEILNDIKKYDTSWKIYLEVGATASVLAWDLSKEGYHAFDMGDFYKRSQEVAPK